MIDILFKAKRKDNGSWEKGYYVALIISEGKKHYIYTGVIDTTGLYPTECRYEIYPETLCQYVGLTDEKGKKIYENDIVAFEDRHSTENGYAECDCEGQVVWDDEELCFSVTERLSAESYEVLGDYCVVIGNVYDCQEQEMQG